MELVAGKHLLMEYDIVQQIFNESHPNFFMVNMEMYAVIIYECLTGLI